MQYKEIIAPTYAEARAEIKKQFGNQAKIIRTVEKSEGGILGFGKKKFVQVLVSISEADLLKKYREKMNIPDNSAPGETQEKSVIAPGNDRKDRQGRDLKTIKGIEQSPSDNTLSLVLDKLNNLENMVGRSGPAEVQENLHPHLQEVKELLKENEFFDDFIDTVIGNIKENVPISKIEDREELQKYTYEYIKETLGLFITPVQELDTAKKNIYILVGPTGVGKTTTVAKIAANAVRDKQKVELITIDGYRIGAKYQLEKYAELMNIKMSGAEDNLELQKRVDLSDASLILIDTTGRSQKDEMNLVKMKQMLDIKRHKVHFILTVSATTKPKDVERIFKSFEIFDYSRVIVTKSDESESIGSILNLIIKREKKLMYYTNGQRVPDDIRRANIQDIMTRIKGFDPRVYLANVDY